MVSGVGMGQLSEAGVVGWLVLSTGHGDGLTLQEGELLDVVDEADLGSGSIHSDGADEQGHTALLLGEDGSTAMRTLDLAPVARAMLTGIGRPGGFLRWTRETKPLSVMKRWLASDQ